MKIFTFSSSLYVMGWMQYKNVYLERAMIRYLVLVSCHSRANFHFLLNKNIPLLVSGYIADVNECQVNNGGCHRNATCINVIGSRVCICNEGYEGDGVGCKGKDLESF